MVSIDDAIKEALTEAQADEIAEKEVNKSMMEPKVNNMVTLSLEEYISLYTSAEKYCRLLALVCSLSKPSDYREARLSDENKILDFISYNDLDAYMLIMAHVNELKERGE